MPRTTRPLARLLVATLAVATVLVAAPASPAPVGAADDRPVTLELEVLPGPTTSLGTQLTLTGTLEILGEPFPGGTQPVEFLDGDTVVAETVTDSAGRATVIYTPSTAGVHGLWASIDTEPIPEDITSEVHEHTVVDPSSIGSEVLLIVSPRDSSPAGAELSLTAFVGDPWPAEAAAGEVVFLDGDVSVATRAVGLDRGVLVAATTYTPSTPGVRELSARFSGSPGVPAQSSDPVVHRVLPSCPDQARPGAGAVVRHLSLVALRRCPDPAGYAYWVGRLEGGARPEAVASALAGSTEAIGVVVDDAYRRILHRPVDADGRRFWTAKVRAGWTTSQLWASLAASDELARGVDGLEELVEEAFARIVGRPADPGGAAYWLDRFMASRTPPSGTWRAMAVTAEVIDGAVDAAHLRALGRTATSAEGAVAAADVRARRGDWRPLVAELLGRPEASAHAQTYPEPPVDG